MSTHIGMLMDRKELRVNPLSTAMGHQDSPLSTLSSVSSRPCSFSSRNVPCGTGANLAIVSSHDIISNKDNNETVSPDLETDSSNWIAYEDLQPLDVVMGRGSAYKFPGSCAFRQLVQGYQQEYLMLPNKRKSPFVHQIMHLWIHEKGGRFVQKVASSLVIAKTKNQQLHNNNKKNRKRSFGYYQFVSLKRVYDKVSQSLRDRKTDWKSDDESIPFELHGLSRTITSTSEEIQESQQDFEDAHHDPQAKEVRYASSSHNADEGDAHAFHEHNASAFVTPMSSSSFLDKEQDKDQKAEEVPFANWDPNAQECGPHGLRYHNTSVFVSPVLSLSSSQTSLYVSNDTLGTSMMDDSDDPLQPRIFAPGQEPKSQYAGGFCITSPPFDDIDDTGNANTNDGVSYESFDWWKNLSQLQQQPQDTSNLESIQFNFNLIMEQQLVIQKMQMAREQAERGLDGPVAAFETTSDTGLLGLLNL